MIIKDKNKLRTKCETVTSMEEGEKIAVDVLKDFSSHKSGVGLAANQIGINKRVCVVFVKEPIVLINPEVVSHSEEQFIYNEGCLSFPGKYVKVKRYEEITIKADNLDDDLTFQSGDRLDSLECAAVQHELMHLDGKTMFDDEYRLSPIISEKKIGRNDKVTITNGTETKTMKYKKALPLIDAGKWRIEYGFDN